MKRVKTNREVTRDFVQKSQDTSYNQGRSLKQNRVTPKQHILYSYDVAIAVTGEPLLVNGDRYSNTTSNHIGSVQSRCRENKLPHFTTSFSALSRFISWADSDHAGVRHLSEESYAAGKYAMKELKVIDWEEDFRAAPDREGNFNIELPPGTTISYHQGQAVYAHRAASAVFAYNGHFALAGFDERQFFVAILPHPVASLNEAYESLKPWDVKDAESMGLKVDRQGEWFFIPQHDGREAREIYNRLEERCCMGNGNPHIATRGELLREGAYLVTGRVRHPDHKTLVLSEYGNPEIFIAVENTALQSFSSFGRVD
jgi:hypothetical protein